MEVFMTEQFEIAKEEIIKLAVAASKEYDKQQKIKNLEIKKDRRLRNTRLLLKHYNKFKEHIDKAIYMGTSIDFVDNKDNIEEVITINSVRESISRTHIMLVHVRTMLQIFENYCKHSNEIEKRRYRTLDCFYFKNMTLEDIADIEEVDERTSLRDLRCAEDKMCALIFGIEGIDMMSE